MKKTAILFVAMSLMMLMGACKKVNEATPVNDDDDDLDSIAAQYQVHDSIMLDDSELSVTDFIGIDETYTPENGAAIEKHFKPLGLKRLIVKADSASNGGACPAWGRDVELASDNGESANQYLRFRALSDNALGLYINRGGRFNSQIFFADKRLIPVYVKELLAMDYELQEDKSTNQLRFYSAKKEQDSFDQSFCIVITDQGCALTAIYEKDDDND